METIKFETNVPQIVSLAFSEGKPVMSSFTGEQLMFSTVDGKRFYVPPIVGDKLREHGVTARVPIELCKKQVGRSIEWQIKTHNANAASAVSDTAPTVCTAKHTASPAYPNSYIEQERAAMASRIVAAQPLPATTPGSRDFSPRAKRMMAAMLDAVDVVIETERYLECRGGECQAEFESIRAIAATFFIQECKGGAA